MQDLIANPAPLEQQLDLELLLECGGDEVSDNCLLFENMGVLFLWYDIFFGAG